MLIDEYKKIKNEFRNPQIKKNTLWKKIQETFASHGYGITIANLDAKMRNMKHHYKTVTNNNKKSTTGRGRVKWEYFESFQEIFREDRTLNPIPVLSSLTSPTHSKMQIQQLPCAIPGPSTFCQSEISIPQTNVPNEDPSPRRMETQHFLPEPEPSTSTPTTSQLIRRKRKNINDLREYRTKMLELEERRVQALEELVREVKRNNDIQSERNEILKNNNNM